MISYIDVKNNKKIRTYIKMADDNMAVMKFTDHSIAHTALCAQRVALILTTLGYDERTVELGKIAGLLHDIGNLINRQGHAHQGGIMAMILLEEMGMETEEIAQIATAIGHHDEGSSYPISPLASALVIADKSDVRHSRVRDYDPSTLDIHDQVNFAVKKGELIVLPAEKIISLSLTIDTSVSSVTDYFEIFLGRMLLCRKAAKFFQCEFRLIMNDVVLL